MTRTGSASRVARAFTVIEVIATMTVLSVIGSMVSFLIVTMSRSYTDASGVAQYQAELSTAMTRVTRDLRWIGIDPTSAPVVPLINTVTPSSITWNTNYSLSLVSGELRYVAAGGQAIVLLRDVSAFTIQAYDDSNTALGTTLSAAQCGPIRRIQVTMAITRSGVTQTLRTRVFLRSLMEGA